MQEIERILYLKIIIFKSSLYKKEREREKKQKISRIAAQQIRLAKSLFNIILNKYILILIYCI